MWQFGLFCIFVVGANAAYSSSGAGAGSYSGTGAGTGSGLYSSNYISDDTYGSQYPYIGGYTYVGSGIAPPIVPVFNPFGFNRDLQNFIQSQYNLLHNQFNRVASLFNDQIAQQQAFLENLQHQSIKPAPGETVIYTNYPEDKVKVVYSKYAPTYSSGYAGGYGAAASGAVGPGGVYQSVSTYPGGTVSSRFGGGPTYTSYSSGSPGFSGISTYSSSDSSGRRQAVTSVNDNGRVTTYHTRNK